MREHLYLLTIMALSRAKQGDLEGAMALETRIAGRLSKQAERDWHMDYINSLNLARLERRRENLEDAGRLYRRAFATVRGLRSTSDSVYANVCAARLFERAGHWRDAVSAWLRASLHWLASAAPHALAPRVALSIVAPLPESIEALEAEVAAALGGQLREACVKAGFPASALKGQGLAVTPSYVDATRSGLPSGRSENSIALGGPGWGLVLTPSAGPEGLTLHGRPIAELGRFVAAVIRAACPAAAEAALDRIVVVDDRFGIEVPCDRVELAEVCVRLAVPVLIFDDRRLVLDRGDLLALERATLVGIGPGVSRLDLETTPRRVQFKRYRLDLALTEQQSLVLGLLDRPRSIGDLEQRAPDGCTPDQMLSLLRALERQRVVELKLPKTALSSLDGRRAGRSTDTGSARRTNFRSEDPAAARPGNPGATGS